jgi:hypothetical protein
MLRSVPAAAVFGLLTLSSITAPTPARADPGDPPGWSVEVDPRQRAFLKYVAEKDGPRLLLLGCLRDVDSFTVIAAGLPNNVVSKAETELTLTVADASWSVTGAVERNGLSGQLEFSVDLDFDRAGAAKIAKPLRRVLGAPGPIVLQVGNAEAVELTLEPLPPRAGIAEPLKTFETICFGKERK